MARATTLSSTTETNAKAKPSDTPRSTSDCDGGSDDRGSDDRTENSNRTEGPCPCGHDELKTTGDRPRAHKSDGAACPLLAQLGEKACDRDALASLNMVSCALCSLDGRGRPGYLCRTRFSNCEH